MFVFFSLVIVITCLLIVSNAWTVKLLFTSQSKSQLQVLSCYKRLYMISPQNKGTSNSSPSQSLSSSSSSSSSSSLSTSSSRKFKSNTSTSNNRSKYSNSNNDNYSNSNNNNNNNKKKGSKEWKSGYIFVEGKKNDNRRNPRRNDPWWMRDDVR